MQTPAEHHPFVLSKGALAEVRAEAVAVVQGFWRFFTTKAVSRTSRRSKGEKKTEQGRGKGRVGEGEEDEGEMGV